MLTFFDRILVSPLSLALKISSTHYLMLPLSSSIHKNTLPMPSPSRQLQNASSHHSMPTATATATPAPALPMPPNPNPIPTPRQLIETPSRLMRKSARHPPVDRRTRHTMELIRRGLLRMRILARLGRSLRRRLLVIKHLNRCFVRVV